MQKQRKSAAQVMPGTGDFEKATSKRWQRPWKKQQISSNNLYFPGVFQPAPISEEE